MAYPGSYNNPPNYLLTSSQRDRTMIPASTNQHNLAMSYLNTTLPQQRGPSSIVGHPSPNNSSYLMTNNTYNTVPAIQTANNSLYTPQIVQPAYLKSGFVASSLSNASSAPVDPSFITPNYLNDQPTMVQDELGELEAAAIDQESCLRSTGDLSQRAQALSLQLWKISTVNNQLSAPCSDLVEVFHNVQMQTADFHADQAAAFQSIIDKLHSLNISSLSPSLFSQTVHEIHLSRIIHFLVNSKNISGLKEALRIMSYALGRQASTGNVSSQTVDVLRGLVYFAGISLYNLIVSSQLNEELENLPKFMLENVLEARSAQWAAALIQPTLKDLLFNNWLDTIVNPKYLPKYTEVELKRLICQIPWNKFISSASPNPFISLNLSNLQDCIDSIKNSILIPLQQALQVAANSNYVSAIILISKILALISRIKLPSGPDSQALSNIFAPTCVGISMRGPWPSKMICIPSLQLYDWESLDLDTLCLLFGELYHLFQTKVPEYAGNSSRASKIEHRDQFANFVVSNQLMMAVVYQVDEALAKINYNRHFPIFFIFSQIGIASLASRQPKSVSNPFDLPRLIAEEIFYFAAVWTPSQTSPNYHYQMSMLPTLRLEAHDALQRLCQEHPRLFSPLYTELLHCMSLPNFDLIGGLRQLQPQIMVIDNQLIDSLAYLLLRKSFDPLPAENSPSYRSSVNTMAESILAQFNHGPAITAAAWNCATVMIENLNWSKASPMMRTKAILLLLALNPSCAPSPRDAASWRFRTLSSNLLNRKSSANLGQISTELLLEQLNSHQNDPAAIATRIVIALNAALSCAQAEQLRASQLRAFGEVSPSIHSENVMAKYTFSWLWDSFRLKDSIDKLFQIASKEKQAQAPPQATPSRSTRDNIEYLSSSVNKVTDSVNSIAAGLTSTIFGYQPENRPTQNSQLATSSTAPQVPRTSPTLALTQRVLYQYGHTMKHSTMQMQRDVSVFFNILVSKVEEINPGSGFRVVQDLFNESLGPSSAQELSEYGHNPQDDQSRSLWLNFWVYALIPQLSKWKESETLEKILDAFSYSSFFSQARYAEICSLLPGGINSLERTEIDGLLTRRRPWLLYLLLWAYQPADAKQPNRYDSQAHLSRTPLWKWYEAATSPSLKPELSIIFWERFFWTYFEVGAELANTDFLEKKTKEIISASLFRIAMSTKSDSKAPSDGFSYHTHGIYDPNAVLGTNPTTLNKVFSNLLSWNKTAIFQSGANLFQPLLMAPNSEEAPLLAEIHTITPVPPIFAVAYDQTSFNASNSYIKPFPPLPPVDSIESIISSIYPPKVDSSNLVSSEHQLNMYFVQDIQHNYQVLLTSHSQSLESSRLPVLDDIEVWNIQIQTLAADMEACDKEHMSIIRRLWKVVEKPYQRDVTCGSDCTGPARLSCIQKSIVPGSPTIQDDLKHNREQFQMLHSSHFSAQKSLAHAATVLEEVARYVLQGNNPDLTHALTVRLFFEVLPFVINQSIPASHPLYSKLVKFVLLLGQAGIINRPDRNQMKFFKQLLEGSKKVPKDSQQYRNLNPSALVSPRSEIFELFTPTCFIEGDNYAVYVELLYIFVNTPNELTQAEETSIASQFNLVDTLPHLVRLHFDRLFQILELAAVKPALVEVVNLGIAAILKAHHASPAPQTSGTIDLLGMHPVQNSGVETIGRVVRLVLLACPSNPLLGSWDMIRDEWLRPEVVPYISSVFPSTNPNCISSAVQLMRRIVKLPSFIMDLHVENLARFFKVVFNTTAEPLLSKKNQSAFVGGIELLVATCHPDLIWPIYLNILTPFFAHNNHMDHTAMLDVLCGAKWNQLSLYLRDPAFVVNLASLPLFHFPLVRTIFSQIDWKIYASQNQQENSSVNISAPSSSGAGSLIDFMDMDFDATLQQSKPAPLGPTIPIKMIHFLSLFCKMNILYPTYLDAGLRKLVMSISTNPNNWFQKGKHLFDWRMADPTDFAAAFRGNSLIAPFKHLSTTSRPNDPSVDLKDNIKLLNDVCRFSGCPEAIEVCMQEIKSCLFVLCQSSSAPGYVWHLPLHDNVDFVTSYMIPLAQQYHVMQTSRSEQPQSESGAPKLLYRYSSYSALTSLLSCITGNPQFCHLDCHIPFSTTLSSVISSPEFNSEIKHTFDVIFGLIVRFVGTMDADLCLAVIHVAARAYPTQPNSLVLILEQTLRAFFIQSTFTDQLKIAVDALVVVDESSALAAAAASHCPLSYRLILSKAALQANTDREFTNLVCDNIEAIAQFMAPENREFDIIPLWLFIIDAVTNPKFQLSPQTAQKIEQIVEHWNMRIGERNNFLLSALAKLNNSFDASPHKVPIQLAARACKIFLKREIVAKAGLGSSELESQVSAFLKLFPGKQGSEIQRYAQFFEQVVPHILSPLMDRSSFELKMLQLLFPIAPYLQSFVEGAWVADLPI